VEVLSGKEHAARHALPELWQMLDKLPRTQCVPLRAVSGSLFTIIATEIGAKSIGGMIGLRS
jgi:hypothetical protein